jgi:hypothetical protein
VSHVRGTRHFIVNIGGTPLKVTLTTTVTTRRGRRSAGHRPARQPCGSLMRWGTDEMLQGSGRTRCRFLTSKTTQHALVSVEVSHANGAPIASGAGANQLNTLQDAVKCMLPQNHPDYPQLLPNHDEE